MWKTIAGNDNIKTGERTSLQVDPKLGLGRILKSQRLMREEEKKDRDGKVIGTKMVPDYRHDVPEPQVEYQGDKALAEQIWDARYE